MKSKNIQGQSVFLEHLEAQILKILLLSTNHGGTFKGSVYVSVYPKNSRYVTANKKPKQFFLKLEKLVWLSLENSIQ